MSVELTSFERLTLSDEHPLMQQYQREQQEARKWRTDYCRTQALGALCLDCTASVMHTEQSIDTIDQAA